MLLNEFNCEVGKRDILSLHKIKDNVIFGIDSYEYYLDVYLNKEQVKELIKDLNELLEVWA